MVRVLSILICLLFVAAPAMAKEKGFKEDNVTNENIASFKTIDEIFTALGLLGCTPKDIKNFWHNEMVSEGIVDRNQDCKKHYLSTLPQGFAPFAVKLKANDSGILNDNKQEGNRVMRQFFYPDCERKDYWIRYTYDRVETKDGVLCGFEVFIKKPSGEIVGVALNRRGEVLPVVPPQLAFDKDGNKEHGKSSQITSGKGCFECHPRVSSEYGMTDQEKFWDKTEFLPRRTPNDNHTPAIIPPGSIR